MLEPTDNRQTPGQIETSPLNGDKLVADNAVDHGVNFFSR
jgi:hypothetical protein